MMDDAGWEAVATGLEILYNKVDLICDGYRLTLQLVRISQFRNAITFYVNGEFLGKWFFDACEERRRFFRPVRRYEYTSRMRKTMHKMSKQMLKQMNLEPDKKYTAYFSHWTSTNALRRHLEKHNTSIELAPADARACACA